MLYLRMDSKDLGHTGTGVKWSFQAEEDPARALQPPAHLDTPVVYPGGLALDAAGVAAAGAALHLHAGRPYEEVGRGGVDLAPRYLVDHRPCLAHRRDGLLCGHRRVTPPAEQPSPPQSTHVDQVHVGPVLPVPTGHWQASAERCLLTAELWCYPGDKLDSLPKPSP